MEGERFDELEVTEFVRNVAESTAANTFSMLQDVLWGRETEIDAINGFVPSIARRGTGSRCRGIRYHGGW
jgi:2-dehydropantoate 2-reductase